MAFPEWYDGPALYVWLKAQGVLRGEGDSSFGRAANRWRSGTRAGYATVDKFLTPLGLHLDEIPESVWALPPRVGGRPGKQGGERRERGYALLRAGLRQVDVARELGVSTKTVGLWKRKLNESEGA